MNLPQIITKNEDKIKDALAVWAEWMRDMGDHHLGWGRPSGFDTSSKVSGWEDFERKVDHNLAINVQAIYEGLPNIQQLAIDHFHLAAVWRSNRGRIEDHYSDALISVEVALRRRGLL